MLLLLGLQYVFHYDAKIGQDCKDWNNLPAIVGGSYTKEGVLRWYETHDPLIFPADSLNGCGFVACLPTNGANVWFRAEGMTLWHYQGFLLKGLQHVYPFGYGPSQACTVTSGRDSPHLIQFFFEEPSRRRLNLTIGYYIENIEKIENAFDDDGDEGNKGNEDVSEPQHSMAIAPAAWVVIGLVVAMLVIAGLVTFVRTRRRDTTQSE
jgi:hypothetical protein